MSLAATLGSRFALLVGGRFTLLGLSLLSTALLTRILGPDGFGHFRTAVAFLALAISLADLGLASLFVREISRRGADQARIIANALGLRLAIAGSAMAIAVALAFVLPLEHQDRLGILGGAFGFLAYSVHLLLFGLFQQKLRQEGVVLAEVSGGVVLILLIVGFAWAGADPWHYALAMGLSYAFTLLVTVLAARRLIAFRIAFEPAVCWRLVREGAPLAVATATSVLYFRADTVLLAVFDTPAEVGHYGVPVKIMDAFMGVTLLFVGLFAPFLANTANVDEPAFRAHLGNALRTLAIGTIGIGVGIVALAPEIVRLVAGPEFGGSVPILQILAGVLVVHGTTLVLRETATALAIQEKLLPGYVLGLAVAFLGYFALIPRLGGVGAATALLIATLVVFAFVAQVVVRATGAAGVLRIPAQAAACGLVTVALLLGIEAAGHGLLTRLLAAGLVYPGLLLATRSLSLPELLTLGRDMLARRSGSA